MRKVLNVVVWTAFALSNLSCNKFLDINAGDFKPLKESFYQTEDDFRAALLGTYAILTNGSLYGNRLNGRVGLEVDEGASAYNTDGNGASIGLYENINSANTVIYDIYGQYYKGVRNASTILNSIDGSSMAPGKERDHIKGQALFLRGFYYFSLVSYFGDIPMVEQIEGLDKEVYKVQRTPQYEVLQAVVKDLEEAAALMKPITDVGTGFQASKSAAWGLLARVNLFMAGQQPVNETSRYAEAARYAKMVMDIGYHQLNANYQDIFVKLATDVSDPKEVIFEVNFMGNFVGAVEEKTGSMQGRNNGILNRAPKDFLGHSEGIVVGSPYLHRLYAVVPNRKDVRFDYNMAPYIYETSGANAGKKRSYTEAQLNTPYYGFIRFCGKFRRENEATNTPYHNMYTPQNVSILRYSDVLLMYAEALIRSNPGDVIKYQEAMGYVNQVRRRSIAEGLVGRDLPTSIPPSGGVAADLYGEENVVIQHIIEERARELCFEGLRKFDLNRWGIFYKRAQALKDEWTNTKPSGFSTTGIPANSITATGRYYNGIMPHHNLWPIPATERGLNPNLSQNPDY